MPDPCSSIAFSGRYLDVIWEDGGEYTHNRRCRGVVLVIPVTQAGEIVVIEQFRVPLKGPVIEYPAGLVGDEQDADERFETAARRELLEESGYEAGADSSCAARPHRLQHGSGRLLPRARRTQNPRRAASRTRADQYLHKLRGSAWLEAKARAACSSIPACICV